MNATAQPPKSFAIVSVVLLLWMILGVVMFAMDLMTTPEQIAEMPAEMQSLLNARPQWLFIVYGIATGGGTIAAIGLLMKKAWAVPMFGVSLAAVVVQMGYTTFGLDALGTLGAGAWLPLPIVITAAGAFALRYAMGAKTKGWLA